MREMTRLQVAGLIRRKALEYRTLRAYCEAHGVHISTLSNMLGGRNQFTRRVLGLLGLEHVRIVEQADPAVPLPVRPARAYQPMWRLGDWPRGIL